VSVDTLQDLAAAIAEGAERAASLLTVGSDGIAEACQHLRFVIAHLDSVLDDPTIPAPTFTSVLHMRDGLDAHLRATAVLSELGALSGARRVLTDAAHVALAHPLAT
jgi:hypothetical protein